MHYIYTNFLLVFFFFAYYKAYMYHCVLRHVYLSSWGCRTGESKGFATTHSKCWKRISLQKTLKDILVKTVIYIDFLNMLHCTYMYSTKLQGPHKPSVNILLQLNSLCKNLKKGDFYASTVDPLWLQDHSAKRGESTLHKDTSVRITVSMPFLKWKVKKILFKSKTVALPQAWNGGGGGLPLIYMIRWLYILDTLYYNVHFFFRRFLTLDTRCVQI